MLLLTSQNLFTLHSSSGCGGGGAMAVTMSGHQGVGGCDDEWRNIDGWWKVEEQRCKPMRIRSREEATSLEAKAISGCSWRWSDGERKRIFVVVHGGGPRPQIGIDRADNEGFLVSISHDSGRLCSPTRCC
ncbi:hypothetical protein L1887_30262 [Cichorium endivia]|nr:hypothetical protein L1887_30262 [Cichorium endivia]